MRVVSIFSKCSQLMYFYLLYHMSQSLSIIMFLVYIHITNTIQQPCNLSSALSDTKNHWIFSLFITCAHMLLFFRSEPVLPLLTFAQKKGNATFYEWRTGKVPTVVERPVVEEAPPDTATDDTVGFTVSVFLII